MIEEKIDQKSQIKYYCIGNQSIFKIVLMGAIHGDEPSGPWIIMRNIQQLIKISNQLNLQIIVIPIINKRGYKQNARFEPESGKDLNRCFFEPTPPPQVSCMKNLISQSSLVIDIHANPPHRQSFTGILFTAPDKPHMSKMNYIYMQALNPDLVWHMDFSGIDKEKQGALGEYLLDQKIPNIAIEIDLPRFLTLANISKINKSINKTIRLVAEPYRKLNHKSLRICKRIRQTNHHPGLFKPCVVPLQQVRQGDVIGTVTGLDLHSYEIVSPQTGPVIFVMTQRFVNVGEKLIGVGNEQSKTDLDL